MDGVLSGFFQVNPGANLFSILILWETKQTDLRHSHLCEYVCRMNLLCCISRFAVSEIARAGPTSALHQKAPKQVVE